jgi:predicted phosphodiesterase
MNTLTIFGDLHANLPALEAVWADMDWQHLENRYCLGDLVGYATFPNEVIAFIRQHQVPTLMGNYDQGVGHNRDDCGCAYQAADDEARGQRSIAWTNAHTDDEHKAYLRTLPAHIPLQLGAFSVLLVHGSPRKINEYLYADRPVESLERVLDAAGTDIVVCGHTHLPYHKVLPSGRHLINAGSVGKPKDHNPLACYVILRVVNGQLQTEFRRVVYDVERTVTAIEASTLPHEFARMLRRGFG